MKTNLQTVELPRPKSFAETMMLMKVSIHRWTAQVRDKKVSQEVAEQHGADIDMGKYTKRLVDKAALAEIRAFNSQISVTWKRYTLPWIDGGTRILPSAHFFKANEEIKALIHDREVAVENFVRAYDEHVEDAKRRLNGLFNEKDYPTADAVRDMFGVDVTVLPLPDSADFRVPLGANEDEVREQIDRAVTAAIDDAMRTAWRRVHEVVESMIDRLRAFRVDADGKIERNFHSSVVDNVRDLLEVLPGLNLTGDADLAAVTDRLRDELTVYDANVLRTDDRLRGDVLGKAEAILSDLSAFIA